MAGQAGYPFESHYFNTPAGAMHYADEGIGEPIVFGHGNPAWSFEFRHLIKEFSTTNRSCSLSDGARYYSRDDTEYGYSNFHNASDHVHQNPRIKSSSLQESKTTIRKVAEWKKFHIFYIHGCGQVLILSSLR